MTNETQSVVFTTDGLAKACAAAQVVDAHTDAELTRILATVDNDMAELIRRAAARLGRRL